MTKTSATKASGSGADVKVAVDAAATADYLGATDSAGALRVSSPLAKTDGGDFITLGVTQSAIDHGSLGGLSDDDHSQYIIADGPARNGHIMVNDGEDESQELYIRYYENGQEFSYISPAASNHRHGILIHSQKIGSTTVELNVEAGLGVAYLCTADLPFYPDADGMNSLGTTDHRWRKLWTAEGITDGTDTVTVAEIKTGLGGSGVSEALAIAYAIALG